MPQCNIDAALEVDVTEGGFKQVEPGHYVLRVVDIRTQWTERDYQTGVDKQCSTQYDNAVLFIYDIADGEFAGEYSRDFFFAQGGKYDPEKDYMHQYKLYWGNLNDPKDLGEIKSLLNVFTRSNPGFDAVAAFKADQWQLFIGKLFGAVLNGTVRTNDKGYDNWRCRPGRKVYTPEEIYSGNFTTASGEVKPIPAPRITDKREKVDAAPTAAPASMLPPTDIYGDIPFNV